MGLTKIVIAAEDHTEVNKITNMQNLHYVGCADFAIPSHQEAIIYD